MKMHILLSNYKNYNSTIHSSLNLDIAQLSTNRIDE